MQERAWAGAGRDVLGTAAKVHRKAKNRQGLSQAQLSKAHYRKENGHGAEGWKMERNTAERQMLDFYRNKKVLVTGHTGFKGTWLTRMLLLSGAQVQGYSLEPPTRPNLYSMAGLSRFMESGQLRSEIGDIRDFGRLQKIFHDFRPEIVFHLAAQPIVRESYRR